MFGSVFFFKVLKGRDIHATKRGDFSPVFVFSPWIFNGTSLWSLQLFHIQAFVHCRRAGIPRGGKGNGRLKMWAMVVA